MFLLLSPPSSPNTTKKAVYLIAVPGWVNVDKNPESLHAVGRDPVYTTSSFEIPCSIFDIHSTSF
jgi:hypothetical protein